jgi:hypothetical protein
MKTPGMKTNSPNCQKKKKNKEEKGKEKRKKLVVVESTGLSGWL